MFKDNSFTVKLFCAFFRDFPTGYILFFLKTQDINPPTVPIQPIDCQLLITHRLSLGSPQNFQETFWLECKWLPAGSPMCPSSDPQVKLIHPLPRETLGAQTSPNPATATLLTKKLMIRCRSSVPVLQESHLKITMVLMKHISLGMLPIPCQGQGQGSLYTLHQILSTKF